MIGWILLKTHFFDKIGNSCSVPKSSLAMIMNLTPHHLHTVIKSLFHHLWSTFSTHQSTGFIRLKNSISHQCWWCLCPLVIKDHYHRLKSSHRGSFSDPHLVINSRHNKTKWQTSCFHHHLPLFTTAAAGHFTVGSL